MSSFDPLALPADTPTRKAVSGAAGREGPCATCCGQVEQVIDAGLEHLVVYTDRLGSLVQPFFKITHGVLLSSKLFVRDVRAYTCINVMNEFAYIRYRRLYPVNPLYSFIHLYM